MVSFSTGFANALRFAILLALCFIASSNRLATGQAFRLDLSGIPEDYRSYFTDVERDLNTRIQDYSNELPRALLYNLNKLFIVARIAPAPAGVLGFAGPTGTVSMRVRDPFNPLLTRNLVVPVTGQITINANEIDQMITDGLLVDTIAHEILHTFGFGSLWIQNRLIRAVGPSGPVNDGTPDGLGLGQYFGKYALQQYRLETNNRFAGFVPIEQFGGAGTALSHWSDEPPFFNQTFTPAFKKELMTGFACDLVPDTVDEFVCPPTFFSMTTEGALADLGFAMYRINPNRVSPPTGLAGRNWPKIVGSNLNPFADPNARFSDNGNLSFRRVNIVKVYKQGKTTGDGLTNEEPDLRSDDPFHLRNHNWADK
jgi:hypothetical protein